MKTQARKILAAILLLIAVNIFIACDNQVDFKIYFMVDDIVYYTIDTSETNVSMPANPPDREGFTFDGWYWDKGVWNQSFTLDSLLNAPLTESFSVYAYYKPVEPPVLMRYTITYDACGGTTDEADYTATEGSGYTLDIPERDGYTFDGWYSEIRGGGEKYTGADGIGLTAWDDSDITLHANWYIAVKAGESLQEAVAAANAGDEIRIEEGVYSEILTINKDGLKITGSGTAVIKRSVTVIGDNVTLESITFKFAYGEGGLSTLQEKAPINAEGKTLTIVDCIIERTTEAAQSYGWLVQADVLNARDTVFIAPYNPLEAYEKSPSTIKAQGGLYMDGCTIRTNGYGLFTPWVSKGEVKNTVFEGLSGLPAYAHVNNLYMEGIVFDGCTFKESLNALIMGGSFTIKNSLFDNTSATANALYIYVYNTAAGEGGIVIEGNTFKFNSFLGGICFSGADWAPSTRDMSKISVTNNVFEGQGRYALRQYNRNWDLIDNTTFPQNEYNGNIVENT